MLHNVINGLNVVRTERIVPEKTEKGITSIHLKRYQFAAPYCKDKIVLDAACGVGYGTFYLADFASEIAGLDINQNSINYAKKHYRKDNASFIQMDISKEIKFADKHFDIICSFETIEHLSDINIYLQETVRVLKDDGVYFVSTPYVKKTTFRTNNIYHYAEYAVRDLEKILRSYFRKIEFFAQRRKSNSIHRFLRRLDIFNMRQFNLNIFKRLSRLTGNVPFAELSLDDIEIVRDDFCDAATVIAICRGKKS